MNPYNSITPERQSDSSSEVVTTTAAAHAHIASVVEERRAAKVAGVSGIYQRIFERAYSGHSPKTAIKAFCLDCTGFMRSEITNCTALACPLYPYRPYQPGEPEETDEAISPDAAAAIEPAASGKPEEARDE